VLSALHATLATGLARWPVHGFSGATGTVGAFDKLFLSWIFAVQPWTFAPLHARPCSAADYADWVLAALPLYVHIPMHFVARVHALLGAGVDAPLSTASPHPAATLPAPLREVALMACAPAAPAPGLSSLTEALAKYLAAGLGVFQDSAVARALARWDVAAAEAQSSDPAVAGGPDAEQLRDALAVYGVDAVTAADATAAARALRDRSALVRMRGAVSVHAHRAALAGLRLAPSEPCVGACGHHGGGVDEYFRVTAPPPCFPHGCARGYTPRPRALLPAGHYCWPTLAVPRDGPASLTDLLALERALEKRFSLPPPDAAALSLQLQPLLHCPLQHALARGGSRTPSPCRLAADPWAAPPRSTESPALYLAWRAAQAVVPVRVCSLRPLASPEPTVVLLVALSALVLVLAMLL
jgi:hypothetical protein